MKHDPKSFQAGLSVGVSLRGWATAGTGSDAAVVHIFREVTKISVPPQIIVTTYAQPPINSAIAIFVPQIIPTTYESPEEAS